MTIIVSANFLSTCCAKAKGFFHLLNHHRFQSPESPSADQNQLYNPVAPTREI
jgi:hypothetical protein